MHQIDDADAVVTKPTPAAAGTKGWFQQTLTLKTRILADWLNLVQGELIEFLTRRGITQSKTATNQVYLAVKDMIQSDGNGGAVEVINPFMNSLHFQHTEASGVTGGNATANTYAVRPINNIATNGCYNNIAGASLATNQITLPEGTYEIKVNACAYNNGAHRLKLIMDGATDLVVGTMSGNADTASLIQPNSHLSDQRFSIPSGVHYVEIEMWSSDSNAASTAYGFPASIAGEIENYLSGTIKKVG